MRHLLPGGKGRPYPFLPAKAIWILSAMLQLFAGSVHAQTENYSQWAYSSRFDINTTASGANVATAEINFPMLVRLPSNHPAFGQALADGADLRFSDADGTQLVYEIERWDKAARKAEIWVRIPKVDGNSSSDWFTMHWGKAGAVAKSDGESVFSGFVDLNRSNYHLSDMGTGQRFNSAWDDEPAQTVNYDGDESREGVIARCDSLDGSGSGDHLDLGDGFVDIGSKGLSFSMWHFATNQGSWARLVDLGSGPGADNFVVARENETGSVSVTTYIGQNAGNRVVAETGMDQGRWRHVAVTLQGIKAKIYVDGELSAQGDVSALRDVTRTRNYVGRSNWTNNAYYQGKVDEVYIGKGIRSAGWIKLSFETQKTGSKVLTETVAATNTLSLVDPPKSVSAAEGSNVTFTALFLTTSPLTYQWLKDGNLVQAGSAQVPASGPATLSHTLQAIAPSDAGSYICIATDGRDTIRTAAATLTVTENVGLWPRAMKIGFNTTAAGGNVPDSVRNFSMPIRLNRTNFDFSTAAAGGADLRFTDPDGTVLSHQVAHWEAGEIPKAEIWVRVPQVDGNSDRDFITMHWGRAGVASTSSAAAVFRAEQSWLGVWHLNEPAGAGPAADASTKGNNGKNTDATAGAAGHLGLAYSYNGLSSRVNLPGGMMIGIRDFTLSMWVKETSPRACEDNERLICSSLFGAESPGDGSGDLWIVSDQGKLSLNSGLPGGPSDTQMRTSVSLSDGKWHFITVTHSPTALKLYEAGVQVGSTAASGRALDARGFDIGNLSWSTDAHTDALQGLIDEVQFSTTDHSANWVKLTYESQRDDGRLLAYGTISRAPPPAPDFLPAPGSYPGPITVTLGSADSLATIHYTLNGATPVAGQSGTFTYSVPLALPRTATIKALATRDGLTSAVTSATYNITRFLNAKDTLLPGEEGVLPGGQVLRYPSGISSVPVFVEIGSSGTGIPAGFEPQGPTLILSTAVGSVFPSLVVVLTTAQDPVELFRKETDGTVMRLATYMGGLPIASPGTWFWGHDFSSPTLRLTATPKLSGDTLQVAFRPGDNVKNLRCRLEFWTAKPDSTPWTDCAAGQERILEAAIPGLGFEPLEVRLSASDGGIEVHHPEGSSHALTVSHPLPSGAGPVKLEGGRKWALAALPASFSGRILLKDLADANGGADLAAGLWHGSPDIPHEGSYSILTGEDTLPLGGAVWLASDKAVEGLSLPAVRSLASDSQGSFPLRLHKGWNQVGGPSLRALPWVATRDESDAYLQSDVKVLHSFTGANYAESDTLLPWQGYFVYHHGGDTTIHIHSVPAEIGPVAKTSAFAGLKGSASAGVTLRLEGRGGAALRLGARGWAADGIAVEDEPLPPAMDGAARPRILRMGRALASDYIRRGPDDGPLRWTLAAGDRPGGGMDVSLLNLPQGWQAWAFPKAGGARLRLVDGGGLPLAAADTLAILAGTPEALATLPEWKASREIPGRAEIELRRDAAGPYLHLALPGAAKVRWTVWRADGRGAGGRSGRAPLELGPGWHRLRLDGMGGRRAAPMAYWAQVEVAGEGWRLRRALPFGGL